MNPHFIFNVLNGLQSVLILKSEQEINLYMGHLSALLRMTLDLSTTPWALYCDEKSWDSPWVSQANIHATPTLLALDRNLNQLYKAASVTQMDLWLIKNKSVFNSSLVE